MHVKFTMVATETARGSLTEVKQKVKQSPITPIVQLSPNFGYFGRLIGQKSQHIEAYWLNLECFDGLLKSKHNKKNLNERIRILMM